LRCCWLFTLPPLLLLTLAGCASVANPDPQDPYEGFNRAMFEIHESIDQAVLKPAAKAYEAATPLPVRAGVDNFFSNAGDLMTGVNNGLQGKPTSVLTDFARLLINSTLGIFGLFDVASEMGLTKQEEDFGQTLARWGVGEGAYLFLPFFGPRTLRDGAGLIVDIATRPLSPLLTTDEAIASGALQALNIRAKLFSAENVMETAATDKYAYLRSAYLQRRKSQVYDGNPPRPKYENFE